MADFLLKGLDIGAVPDSQDLVLAEKHRKSMAVYFSFFPLFFQHIGKDLGPAADIWAFVINTASPMLQVQMGAGSGCGQDHAPAALPVDQALLVPEGLIIDNQLRACPGCCCPGCGPVMAGQVKEVSLCRPEGDLEIIMGHGLFRAGAAEGAGTWSAELAVYLFQFPAEDVLADPGINSGHGLKGFSLWRENNPGRGLGGLQPLIDSEIVQKGFKHLGRVMVAYSTGINFPW